VFFLKKGSVKIVNSTNDIVKYLVQKGNIFGKLSLYNRRVASEKIALALEDCIICYIESDLIEGLTEKHKSLKKGLLKDYGCEN
jgi:CRP/FNR family transcriptional regulator